MVELLRVLPFTGLRLRHLFKIGLIYAVQMKRIGWFSRLLAGAPWLLGGSDLVVVTFVGYRLGANVVVASCAYLVVVALLSLMGNVIAPVAFSVAAALCLGYCFAPPIFSLSIESASDAALLIASLTVAIIRLTCSTGRAARPQQQ